MSLAEEGKPAPSAVAESGASDTSTVPSPDHQKIERNDMTNEFGINVALVPYKVPEGTTVRDFRFSDPSIFDTILGGGIGLYLALLWMVSSMFPLYFLFRAICFLAGFNSSWDFGARFIVFYFFLCLVFYLKDLRCSPGQPTPPKTPPPQLPTLDDLKWFDRLRYQILIESKRFSLAGTGVFIEDYESLRVSGSKTLICCHPHGIISLAPFCMTYLRELNNYNMISAPALIHWSPLFRLTFSGGFVKMNSADKASFRYAMEQGRGLILVPGGVQEATIHEYGKEKIYLQKRRGFVACALAHGYEIRPMYGFGESLTFDQVAPNLLLPLKFWLNSRGIPTVFPIGNPYFGPLMMARRIPYLLVIGRAIKLPKIERPTVQDIEKYHGIYREELGRIYLAYADQYYKYIRQRYGITAPDPSPEELKRSIATPSFAPPLQLF